MTSVQCLVGAACFAAAAFLGSVVARAHSASDAYVTLTAQNGAGAGSSARTVAHGQWDIALRDLDFVLGLDDNGDGNIVWGELRKHQDEIAHYAYSYIHVSGDGKPCAVVPQRQLVDDHADGAYAALFFDVRCDGTPKRLTFDYRMFFAIDPSHRAILVMRSGENLATSVLSPQNARIDLEL
jgi:hypothetical protein